MGKSTNQPGWTDIAMMMCAMDTLHEGHTTLTISAGLDGKSGVTALLIATKFDVLPGSNFPEVIESKSEFPCAECGSLETHVFRGLYAQDFLIGEAYQQRFLPGVA